MARVDVITIYMNTNHMSTVVTGLWDMAMAVLIAVIFIVSNLAFGRIAFRWPILARLKASPPALALFQVSVGLYISAGALFLLAFDGLSGVDTGAFLVVCVAAVCFEGTRVLRSGSLSAQVGDRRMSLDVLTALVVAGWLTVFLVRALLPPTDWDTLMYHVPLGDRMASQGVSRVDVYFMPHNYPAGVHLLYAFLLKLGYDSAVPVFMLLLGGGGTLVVLHELTLHFWGRVPAILAVLLFIASNVIWVYAPTARVDNIQAFYFIVAAYAVMLFVWRPEQQGWLIVTAVSMSMMLGIKYTAAGLLLVLLPMLLPGIWRAGDRRALFAIGASCLILMFPSSFWYIRNWVQLGDPIYPFLYQKVAYAREDGTLGDFLNDTDAFIARNSPDMGELTAVVRDAGGSALLQPIPPRTSPRLLNIWDVMMHPRRYSRRAFVTVPHVLLLFAGLALLRRDRRSRLLYYIGIAGFIVLASFASQTRYLTPIIPIIAVGAAVVLWTLYQILITRSRALGRIAATIVGLYLAAVIGINLYVEATTIRSMLAGFLAAQPTTELLAMGAGAPLAATVTYFDNAASNARSDRVMLFFETRCYPLKILCWAEDPTFDGHRWLAELTNARGNYDLVAARLREYGVTHIAINRAGMNITLAALMDGTDRQDPMAAERHRHRLIWGFYHLQRFVTRYATWAHQQAGVTIYKLSY